MCIENQSLGTQFLPIFAQDVAYDVGLLKLISNYQNNPGTLTYNSVQQYLNKKRREKQGILNTLNSKTFNNVELNILDYEDNLLWSTAPLRDHDKIVLLYQSSEYSSEDTQGSAYTEFEDGSKYSLAWNSGGPIFSNGGSLKIGAISTTVTYNVTATNSDPSGNSKTYTDPSGVEYYVFYYTNGTGEFQLEAVNNNGSAIDVNFFLVGGGGGGGAGNNGVYYACGQPDGACCSPSTGQAPAYVARGTNYEYQVVKVGGGGGGGGGGVVQGFFQYNGSTNGYYVTIGIPGTTGTYGNAGAGSILYYGYNNHTDIYAYGGYAGTLYSNESATCTGGQSRGAQVNGEAVYYAVQGDLSYNFSTTVDINGLAGGTCPWEESGCSPEYVCFYGCGGGAGPLTVGSAADPEGCTTKFTGGGASITTPGIPTTFYNSDNQSITLFGAGGGGGNAQSEYNCAQAVNGNGNGSNAQGGGSGGEGDGEGEEAWVNSGGGGGGAGGSNTVGGLGASGLCILSIPAANVGTITYA